jgi:hypothetical protein
MMTPFTVYDFGQFFQYITHVPRNLTYHDILGISKDKKELLVVELKRDRASPLPSSSNLKPFTVTFPLSSSYSINHSFLPINHCVDIDPNSRRT